MAMYTVTKSPFVSRLGTEYRICRGRRLMAFVLDVADEGKRFQLSPCGTSYGCEDSPFEYGSMKRALDALLVRVNQR